MFSVNKKNYYVIQKIDVRMKKWKCTQLTKFDRLNKTRCNYILIDI